MSGLARTKSLRLHPGERDSGVIVSCRNLDTGDEEAFHEPGQKKTGDVFDSLRRACERIEQAPSAWVIEAISTPASIYRDLQGVRIAHHPTSSPGVAEFTINPYMTEIYLLGRVGYSHLLTPRAAR